VLSRQRRSHSLSSLYLFGDREQIVESAEDACQRLVDAVNTYYAAEMFSVSHLLPGSFRIGCACGWSLSVLLPADLDAPLDECLERLLRHYEIQHLEMRQ
jgi:hypothetical protein